MSTTILPFATPAHGGDRTGRARSRTPRRDCPREPLSLVYRDAAPPPSVDIHRGHTDERAFVVEVQTVAGEIDSEFLQAIIDYTERVNLERARAALHLERPPHDPVERPEVES